MMRRAGAALTMVALGVAGAAAAAGPAADMIFFDWAKPEIRSDDRATLDRIAAEQRAAPSTRLRIEGHSDRSGPAAVNRRSARARAAAVRDELARRGVPAGAMTILSHGEERPLVPTEDGVREVQNRRVEIIRTR